MAFQSTWQNLLAECEALGDDATVVTPLSNDTIRITDIQEHRIVVEFPDSDTKRPLQREQFETLARRISDAAGAFDLERLPPDADPYPAVLSLHPRFEIDEREGHIQENDEPGPSQLVQAPGDEESETARTEPDLAVYADALLLTDALERHDVTAPGDLETATLVNLYTLLSDVQRNADDLRQDVADVLLERIHHDQPIHAQFGSVQRTSREYRSLRDEDDVLATLEEAGIPRERVTSVDSSKVDDALEVTELSPSDVYEIEHREYVRKADVDTEQKETRLQGLKDQLAASDEPEAAELRAEIDELEARIGELTEFSAAHEFHSE
ncbi:hypothetical protein RBH26_20330 [Natronolimnohabitans sp. A-GB9]|uniref:hypothetical protein n=1 Tax=Natronolimnohabitans sp. A-GB9 TaxID=3069757 RepID=UPI0027AF3FE9|nr:hypothetical protein [Natronolimnohabitans sp. A-GB9]MDQ2052791.1 hypothetical protein [Natronolimnohabitans sp. A-GB9]